MSHFCSGCGNSGAIIVDDKGMIWHKNCLDHWLSHRQRLTTFQVICWILLALFSIGIPLYLFLR